MTKIRQLIDELRVNKCSIELNDAGNIHLMIEDKTQLSEDLIARVKENKSELIDYLKFSLQNVELRIEKSVNQESYAISDAQRRLWVLSQFDGGLVAYNEHGSIYLNRAIDIECFKRAIDSTIERHEILRTVFKEDKNGDIKQWVLKKGDYAFKIDHKDFRNEKNKKELVQSYIKQDSNKPFDLEKGPLLRLGLFQIEDERYVFYYNMHHIISDGWSMEVFRKDTFSYYEAYKENKEPQLKELRIQYKDYSAWQLAQMEGEAYKSHKTFWIDSLSGELPLLNLPTTKQRPAVKTYNGHGLSAYIDSATTNKLKKYSEANGGSLFISLLAGWNVLMYHYTSQTDIIIGTPVAGREHTDLKVQIGCYLNTLALRNEVKPGESFNIFYKELRDNAFKSYSHQNYPFDRLVEELDLQRDIRRSAVFDVMLTLQNAGERIEEVVNEKELYQITDLGERASKFDLEISVQEIGDCLSLRMLYNSDVYEREMVEGLINHYRQLLSALLENPQEKISQINYLSKAEKHELLFTFNATEIGYHKDKTIVELFEEQVKNNPDTIAVIFEEKELSYKKLNELSNQLAHYLQKNHNIKPDDLVGIKQDRSEWMIVSILAVLKAGGAYVPIDPEYPQERINYIEKDTKCKVCIDAKELSKFRKDQKKYSKQRVTSLAKPDNLAYVIYTSGSTGQPKGVMIEHSSLVSFMLNFDSQFGLNKARKIAGSTNITFDISSLEIMGALCHGKELLFLSKEELSDPDKFMDRIEGSGVEVLQLTPSRLAQIYLGNRNFPKNISSVLIGGEELNELLFEKLKKESFKSINVYGPTETTIWSTKLNIKDSERVSIGTPLLNEQIYILNKENKLLPKCVIGEICIGGSGLARGYLNQEKLTKEKFVKNPFKEGERLYKTGDLGRWTSDGNIEFIGRKDDQVKIRGYRIEPGEIENALLKNKNIEEAVVLAKENEQGEKELVAYFTSKLEQNARELSTYLKKLLPEYMLPGYYVQLEALPLNTSGKINKKALPSPQGLGVASGVKYVAPRNEVEEKLVKIWQEVLQRENVGIKDDFFALGGHSLKAVRLSNEYSKEFSVKLSLKELFTHTNVESHSELIQSLKQERFIQIEKVAQQANYPVSDSQRRLWVLSQFEGGSAAYNMPASFTLEKNIQIESFKSAIESTIERHEILRTVFKEDKTGEIKQWILKKEDLNFKIDYKDFRKEKNKAAKVKEYITNDSYKPFDLVNGPLLRAGLIRVEDEEYILYYNMHHIISDGWSMEVLRKDVFAYYDAHRTNKLPELKELSIQYKDYSAWQLAQLGEQSNTAHRNYWLNKLGGELPLLDLPATKHRPRLKTHNGRTLSTYLNKVLSQKLKDYSQLNGGTVFMGLLASLNALLHRYTGQVDLIIGSPIAGREHADLQDQIGFYANTLALRNEVRPKENFNELFSKVKQATLTAYSHQAYPFDRLVEELSLARDTSRSAVFDVMLVHQNNGENESHPIELKEEELNQIVDQGSTISKFDILIHVKEQGNYLSLSVEYNTDVYEEEMIERFIRHYKSLLSKLVSDPKQAIGKISYLAEEEKHELLQLFNNTEADYSGKTVMEIFEERVITSPHNKALIFNEETLTYEELNKRSNALANMLKKNYHVSNLQKVGVMLERSLESVIAMIGVMKTGACYIPIDPNYPRERLAYIIKDSNPEVIVSVERLWGKLDIKESILLDIEKLDFKKGKINNLKHTNQPGDACYVIYTSGSTGKPKGVLQTHRMMSNLIQWEMHHSGVERNLKHLQYTSFSFDVHLQDYWAALCAGGTIYIADEKIRTDFPTLWTYILSHEIEVLSFPVSAFQQLLIQNSGRNLAALSIKHIIVSGEQLLINSSFQKFLEINSNLKLHNHYGPSETHVVTSYRISSGLGNIESRASIGSPVSNSWIYILDEHKNLVPCGVKGELYIGGNNLAIGYLNNNQLTSERFIKDPFKTGHLVYKTGDHGYWRADGNIDFIGRKDDQVKIRGYRIELGEIEHALQSHKYIEAAIVLVKQNQHKENELAAYITSKVDLNAGELRTYLKELLPDYMLPAYYVQLKALPLNVNGKIDRKSLPEPQDISLASGVEYIAPRNVLEEKLVKIWEQVLQREKIGIKDDFFELGGHSLKAVRLSNEYGRELAVQLSLSELFAHTNIESHAKLIGSSEKSEFVQIEKLEEKESYPISDAQRRLWVLSQYEESSLAYNMPASIALEKGISIDHFKKAIDAAINRHEILRTVFKEDGTGQIRQWILPTKDLNFKIGYKDFRREKNKEEKVRSYIAEDSNRPFDLAKGPLLRAALLQLDDKDYVFYFNMHHIISDGWSLEILAKNVFSFYEAFKENKGSDSIATGLKPLRIQYKDYSVWQLAQLEEESFKAHRAYWLKSLEGELPLLDLPSTKHRPKLKTHNGYILSTYIDAATTGKLKKYSEAKGGSLFMGLLAAWNVLMFRYTSQTDIITGTPVAGREHSDLEDQIGFYVNTLALRNEVKEEDNFDSLFSRVRQNTLHAYSHQKYPFDRLVEELVLQRDISRSPVCDISITYHNISEAQEVSAPDAVAVNQVSESGVSKVKNDIELHFQEIGDCLSFKLIYNQDVYDREMVEKLIIHYKQLLNSLLSHPEKNISQVAYLSEQEKHQLLVSFNDTAAAYPHEKTIADLFEEQAAKTPHDTAVVFNKKIISYKELDELSNRLAHCLQKNYQIGPDDLVGIQLERSERMIIAILGVLKAGGAYVPIDPEYPSSRKEYIINDTSLKLLITEASFIHDIDYYEGNVFAIDVEFEPENYAAEKPATAACSNNLAYVIYTSGSTGNPKGVMVEHRAIVNTLLSQIALLEIGPENKGLQFASFSFDASISEVFIILLSGASLSIIDDRNRNDSELLIDFINAHEIDIATLPPSYLSKINLNELKGLKKLITAGEPAIYTKAIEQLESGIYYNAYGPTETSICATLFKLADRKDLLSKILPIGKPIHNAQVYILNKATELQPVGVIGEICVGGSGLARGYLNKEELTKEKFIISPFKAGDRLYKTGDLGRWLADGNIEFIGRKDDQVKIRGHRIELGEIEHALLKNDQIESAVVIAKNNQDNEKELVAYITGKEAQNTSQLRSCLKESLPEHMIPSYFIQLESLPLNANGKIDRKLLPDPQGLGLGSGVEYVAAVTREEKTLASVWSDVLKREGIGIKDSFYNLGGDSIKSIQVVSRLKQQGYTLKVEHLLRTPVLEELARLMQQTSQVTDQSEVKGRVELTPIQDWFFSDAEIKVPDHYNQSVLLKSKEELDNNLLEKSLSALTTHHDALRMVYKQGEDGAWQQINQDTTSKCFTLDFYDLSETENAIEQMSKIGEQLQSGIDITKGPLLRVAHFRLKDGDRLALIIHHLVVDGVSWRILLEDLASLYSSFKENKKPKLALKTDSFQRWALLQKEYAKGNQVKKESAYWKELCSQNIESLVGDQKAQQDQKDQQVLSEASFRLDKETTELLQTRVHRVYNTEINDILLTGLGLAIKEAFKKEQSVLKMEGHGREEIIDNVDISRTVGWFTTVYPFVLDISKAAEKTEALVKTKEALRKVPNKGIGYGILKYLSGEEMGREIIPEIVFNYLGDFGSNAGNTKNALFEYAPTSENIGSSVAKENTNVELLDVSGIQVRGELSISIRYSKSRCDSTLIEKLIACYEKNLNSLIKELSGNTQTYLTPSDLSFKGLSTEELSKINADNSVEDVYELSPLQEGIYYHWLSAGSGSLYFEQTSYRVKAKKLQIENLRRAYDGLIARHGVLRTSFSNEYAGRCLQIVRKAVAGNFTYEKLVHQKNKEEKQSYVLQVKQEDRKKGFNLSSPSQMRLHIIDLSEGEYEFIWSHYHILMDGWCMSVLLNDFNELTRSEARADEAGLSPVIPYSNYINWLNSVNKESSLDYWKDYLAGYTQTVEIPFYIKTEEITHVESTEYFRIEGELFKKLDALCNQTGITHNTFMQGVWGYLLSRYNGTNDVVFGAVVSGRPAELPGVEEMIGLFINTVPVRIKYEPGNTPLELLKKLQEQSIQSTPHHYINLSEVQSLSVLGKSLINHLMVFENYAVKELTGEGVLNIQGEDGISIESMDAVYQNNYDLNLIIAPSPDSLNVTINYNATLFQDSSLKRLVGHFYNLVDKFTEQANAPLTTINYLSREEEQAILISSDDQVVGYPKEKTIVDLFEEQVARTPENIALVFEQERITYQELDERSNQLADYLQKKYKIKPNDLVGIKQEKNEWILISILGVLKTGGAYLPIDVESPQARKEFIEKDAGYKVCIDETELNKFRKEQEQYSKAKIKAAFKPSDLAYIIYTSGTTGNPKGVMVDHYNVVRLFKNEGSLYDFTGKDVWTMFHSYAFDFSVWEMYGALFFGGKLVIVPRLVAQDAGLYLQLLAKEGVTVLNQTPSAFYNLSKEAEQRAKLPLQIRYVIFGGEALSPGKLQYWKNHYPSCKLVNMYGITETTVHTTYKEISGQDIALNRSNIGKAIPTVSCIILDENKNLVPVGIAGELYVGGAGVARGYLNRKELTAERFIDHPFIKGERLYRSGDKVRQLPNGDLEYLGRIDDQVKIRGYRIELGEIEHALLKNDQIEDAVVVVKENEEGDKELVAYIISKEEMNVYSLGTYLKKTLPDYMIPSHYVQLETFPLTSNGKVNKKALPDPKGLGLKSGVNYVAPRGEIEEKLVKIWEDVLKRENIGVKDDFFDLGGHSLKIIKVINQINKQFGLRYDLKGVYTESTIESMSQQIKTDIWFKRSKVEQEDDCDEVKI